MTVISWTVWPPGLWKWIREKIYSYPGSYSEFVRLKEERQNMEIATERKRQSILRKELEWLMRGARARSTKQKAHIQRIEIMQEKDGPAEESQVQMSSLSSRLGERPWKWKVFAKLMETGS